MSLLGRPWSLLDVDDVERLARRALEDALRARNAHLRPHEYDDAVAFLVATAWELSRNFDASRSGSFSSYCYTRLRLRYFDFLRKQEGRTVWKFSGGRVYERPKREILSLDAATGDDGGRLVETLPAQSSDRQTSVSPALTRILGVRGFGDPRDIDLLRASPSRRVA